MNIFSFKDKIYDSYKFSLEESNLINRICLNTGKELDTSTALINTIRGNGNYKNYNESDFTEFIEFFFENYMSIGFYKYIIKSPKEPSLQTYDMKYDGILAFEHSLKKNKKMTDYPRTFTGIRVNRISLPREWASIKNLWGSVNDPLRMPHINLNVCHSRVIRIKNVYISDDGTEHFHDEEFVHEDSLAEIEEVTRLLLKKLLIEDYPNSEIDKNSELSQYVK